MRVVAFDCELQQHARRRRRPALSS